jgi:hypothetical protein
VAGHLAERRIFTADLGDIGNAERGEPTDRRGRYGHGALPVEAAAYKPVRRRGALI